MMTTINPLLPELLIALALIFLITTLYYMNKCKEIKRKYAFKDVEVGSLKASNTAWADKVDSLINQLRLKEQSEASLSNKLIAANSEIGLLSLLINMSCYSLTLPFVAYANNRYYTAYSFTKQHGVRVKEKKGTKYVSSPAELGVIIEGNFLSLESLSEQLDIFRNQAVIDGIVKTEHVNFKTQGKTEVVEVNIDTILA